MREMGGTFKALGTSYYAAVSFATDFSECHVSPVTGKR